MESRIRSPCFSCGVVVEVQIIGIFELRFCLKKEEKIREDGVLYSLSVIAFDILSR